MYNCRRKGDTPIVITDICEKECFDMPRTKKDKDHFDPKDLKPEDLLKFEIATELGLADKVINGGWRSLTAKESGRIGGLITKRKKELKKGTEEE